MKRVGRITIDLTRELYASANSTVYMGTIGRKAAVIKVTRSKGAESAGENIEASIMQELAVSAQRVGCWEGLCCCSRASRTRLHTRLMLCASVRRTCST